MDSNGLFVAFEIRGIWQTEEPRFEMLRTSSSSQLNFVFDMISCYYVAMLVDVKQN